MSTMTAATEATRFVFVDATEETSGESIKARREAMGMSVTALAKVANVHRNTVANVEAGKTRGTSLGLLEATLNRLEEATGMDSPDLVTSTITLPDGTKVVFAGTADGVAEAAAKYVRERQD